MKPVCTARCINGVHVVVMSESNVAYTFQENTYEGKPKPKVNYPGKSRFDPEYVNFAKKRQVEIKTLTTQRRTMFTPKEKEMIDAVFNMPESAKKIKQHKAIK